MHPKSPGTALAKGHEVARGQPPNPGLRELVPLLAKPPATLQRAVASSRAQAAVGSKNNVCDARAKAGMFSYWFFEG
ncbi:hypothetical protein WAI453_012289 [Rhynchosporium graminicola]